MDGIVDFIYTLHINNAHMNNKNCELWLENYNIWTKHREFEEEEEAPQQEVLPNGYFKVPICAPQSYYLLSIFTLPLISQMTQESNCHVQ
jgi:hypothetical protein